MLPLAAVVAVSSVLPRIPETPKPKVVVQPVPWACAPAPPAPLPKRISMLCQPDPLMPESTVRAPVPVRVCQLPSSRITLPSSFTQTASSMLLAKEIAVVVVGI